MAVAVGLEQGAGVGGARSVSRARSRRVTVLGVAHGLAAVGIAFGWWIRDEYYFVPDAGPGYLLGIVGLAAMTLLLGYSARKRFRFLRGRGDIRRWFAIHMLLGLGGPVAILYHSNFSLGSVNGNIALFCCLSVAGSGVVGRLVYVRVHDALTGRRRNLAELEAALGEVRDELGARGVDLAGFESLQRFEAAALAPRGGVLSGSLAFARLPFRRRRALRSFRRSSRRVGAMRDADPPLRKRLDRAVRRYVDGIADVASFSAFERLFALWHAVHLPLCFLLFATAAVHVVAVHMY